MSSIVKANKPIIENMAVAITKIITAVVGLHDAKRTSRRTPKNPIINPIELNNEGLTALFPFPANGSIFPFADSYVNCQIYDPDGSEQLIWPFGLFNDWEQYSSVPAMPLDTTVSWYASAPLEPEATPQVNVEFWAEHVAVGAEYWDRLLFTVIISAHPVTLVHANT